MEIIKKTSKQALFILIPVSLLSALIEWEKLPVSILIGGLIALANLKGISWGIEGLVGAGKQASGKLVFFSLIRLFIIFVILIVLLWMKIINIAGIFVGFTIVFVLILIEGFRSAKEGTQ